ncbi:MAG: hypothetical protein GX663_07025 [Clostridiales bacterium]|nr:hypothetical protein [Clostridiales bacterium]
MGMEKQRMKVLNKLIDHGVDAEKKITDLSITEILSMDDISKQEMIILAELQNAIRKHKVIEFLSDVKSDADEREDEANGKEFTGYGY